MQDLEIQEHYDKIVISNPETKVDLYIEEFEQGPQGDGSDVYFESKKNKYYVVTGRRERILQTVKITGRDLHSYPSEVQETIKSKNPKTQFLEVGAGLAEFCYKVAMGRKFLKPIVIDPANYELLEDMLTFSKNSLSDKLAKDDSHKILKKRAKKINTLIERCKVYRDPNKIQLYNMTLEDFSRIKELDGIADVVIDYWGPMINNNDNKQELVRRLEYRLKKKKGKLIQAIAYNCSEVIGGRSMRVDVI